MTLWSFVREFQTLIVGFLGFAGVITTLVLNAWYARKQRREERHHERQTMRVALLAELKINRGSLALETERAELALEGKAASVTMSSYTMDDAYRAFTDRIGLLSSEEVYKVMDAYLTLQHCHASLAPYGMSPGTDARFVNVHGEHARMMLGFARRLIGLIDEAIAVLERARDAA